MRKISLLLLSGVSAGSLAFAPAYGQATAEPVPAPAAPATPTTPAAPTPAPTDPAADDLAENPPVKKAPPSGAASPITDKTLADLLKLLGDLENQLGVAKGKATSTALAAFQAAMQTDDKAYSLFMDCTKQVDFDDKGKSGGEFGEWKRQDAVKALHEPEHTTALKLQLQWLVLSIQAANAATDAAYANVVAQVPAFLDAMQLNWKKMKNFSNELNKDVISTNYGRFYKLDQTLQKREGWTLNPGMIDSIYDNIVLPYLRDKKNAAAVAASWKKRIQMHLDVLEVEEKEGKNNPNSRAEENRIKFTEEKQPRLEWGMMKDGFQMNNETASAQAMLAHIRSHLGHKDAGLWIKELAALANHEVVEPTKVADSTTGNAAPPRGQGQQGQRGGANGGRRN